MKTLATFQLLVGLGILLTVWALGPFAFSLSIRSVVVFSLMLAVLASGPTLLLLGSVLVFFSKTRSSGGILGLAGALLSSTWLIYILANIFFGQRSRPLNKWEAEVALGLSLVIVTSSAAAIRLYRMVHNERRSRSRDHH